MSIRLLLDRLAGVAEFLHWQQQTSIPGFLANLEGYALFLLAANGAGAGNIVEVDSYPGRSPAFRYWPWVPAIPGCHNKRL
jgi:hypothetical protein